MKSAHTTIARSMAARVAGLSIILLLALAAVVTAEQTPGLAGQRLAEAAQRYDSVSWPAGPVRAGLPLMELTIDGYSGGPVDFNPGAPVIRRYADEEGVDRFLVEVSVRETPAGARTVLLENLASVSSPGPVPRVASLDISAGDIGFVGRAPEKRIAWIAFLRGNVAVRVVCLDPRSDPHPRMDWIAGAVDQLILGQQVLAAGEKAARITITALSTVRQTCRAGDAVALQLQSTAAPTAIHWVVGGPGQGYVEQDNSGAWLLYTTKEGGIDLTCHALGPNGFTATRTVTIEVKEE
jgi:hypothetical protein